ncbi:hypothetical protein [Rufibacter tibetensis]|uniref:hypothetical protein n=1 Tax=Rufibacter tibetensis TaxID=512763 RepID=UPI000ACC1283|nr:hypothetical protein [Rufibacter tibetensis]
MLIHHLYLSATVLINQRKPTVVVVANATTATVKLKPLTNQKTCQEVSFGLKEITSETG